MRHTTIIVLFLTFIFVSSTVSAGSFKESLENRYFSVIDNWVDAGGPVSQVNSVLVPTCGKLVMLFASNMERARFLTTNRDEWDFRVDVCVKASVHIVHPQPEFENPKIVEMICGQKDALYNKLCARAKIK